MAKKNKILITGATGFIGSHLAELLIKRGYEVVAFDRYNPNNNLGWLERSVYKDKMEIVLGDIRDYDSVYNVMKTCSKVFHLAALIGIPYSYISPLAYIRTNVEGTYNILEAAKNLNFEQVIITSTSETYGSAQFVPISEDHPLVGQSPYSASKIAADQLSISYFKSFSLPVKIVRPFNTFGPRQSSRAIIPTIINQCIYQKYIKLGNLSPTRDLTYVEDTCLGFFEIFKSNKFFGTVTNIGMNKEISVRDLVKTIKNIMNLNIPIKEDKVRIRPKNSEVDRLVCNNEKLLLGSNWSPTIGLKKGLEKTIKWYKDSKIMDQKGEYHI